MRFYVYNYDGDIEIFVNFYGVKNVFYSNDEKIFF